MKIEDIDKVIKLRDEVAIIKMQIKQSKWILSKEVEDREMSITYSGCTTGYQAPSKLFKKIGKLILKEYTDLLIVKQLELYNLIQ